MRPSEKLQQHQQAIRQIVESNHAKNPRIFGSVLHGTDTEQSDLDILIETTQETTLFDIGLIRLQLTQLLGMQNIDVLTQEALPTSFRQNILDEAVLI